MKRKLALTAFTLLSLTASNIQQANSEELKSATEENFIEDIYDFLMRNIYGEYYGQWGLSAINASGAYNRGYTGLNIYTGQPITVGVIDSKVLFHRDLEPNLLRMYPYDHDISGSKHGTHVAGTIAARQGNGRMHGVAYDAQVVPIDLFEDYDNFRYNVSTAMNYYNVKVFNNSWGPVDNYSDREIPIVGIEGAGALTKGQIMQEYYDELGIFRDVAYHDGIMVFAAGNDGMNEVSLHAGLPYYFPELYGHWVAVVATDRFDNIADFSNRCGISSDWCIAAPGVDITSTTYNANFGQKSGTSMATPHVTGALAVMQGAFPYLSANDLLQVMFQTADYIGPRHVYGHGLLNLDAATTPSGYVYYNLADQVNGKRVAAKDSKLHFNPTLRAALADKDINIYIHDEVKSDKEPIKRMFVQKAKFKQLEQKDQHQLRASLGKFSDEVKSVDMGDEASFKIYGINKKKGNLEPRVKFASNIGASGIEVSKNLSLTEQNNWDHLSGVLPVTIHNKKAHQPYNFNGDANNSVSIANELNDTTKFVANYSDSAHKNSHAVNAELVKKFDDHSVSVLFGNNLEKEQFMGTKSSGLFKLTDNATTYYYGVGFSSKASDDIVVFGNYINGVTKGDKIDDSIFTNVSNIKSSAGLLGANYNVNKDQKLTLVYSKPLTVDKGSLGYRNAATIDKTGKLYYTNEQISLSPKNKAQLFELHYAMKIDDDSDFNLSGSQHFNSYENEGKNESAILVNYKARF